ncbi:MAG: Rieske 2Fe-2S domain-containing protein [Planctomycetaceae bacterium]|nr:Rieske 2Fe-2S domain-containing protein [Planctomycetaceae bacterium]
MAEKKKLTTAEILAMARNQDKGGGEAGAGGSGAVEQSSDAAAASAPPETQKPVAAPKSTADILAAARAQGGGAKPSATKPAAGAAPKSTADILAAARAQGKGSGGDAAPAAKSVEAKPTPAKKAGVPEGDRPPLKDMVAAVKAASEGKPVVAPKVPVAKSKPKLPAKQEKVSRRSVMAMLSAVAITPFAAGWAVMGGLAGLWSLLVARFMMPNMVLELPSQFKVGPPSDFPPGTVSEKFKASRGIWIVHSDQYSGNDMIYALLSICTHLGCTPNWLEGEQKFKCPCHGSGFYITGINFEGPAPRPLERVGLRRAEDGMLEVDKSLKFQEELGQWSDPKSFYPVA